MSFEIKDLAGLSQPLVRLIDVLSAGAGSSWRFFFAKKIGHREGAAAAEKIRQISDAISEAQQQQATLVRYKDDNLEILPASLSEQSPSTLSERAKARAEFVAEKQQENVEMIAAHAALQLSDKSSVPGEKPDEDWISRFFAISQEISSPQMQELWGRILAGEIIKPGTYSLRTLDFVRNLTKSDAKLIERLAEVTIVVGDRFVPFCDDPWYQTVKNLIPNEFFILGELGIVFPTHLSMRFWDKPEANAGVAIGLPGDKLLYAEQDIQIGPLAVTVWKVTKLGAELLTICQPAFDLEFAQFLGRKFRQLGKKASVKERVLENLSLHFRTIEEF
jgi:Protein of unknown function (DUF2806)